ncbi:hypothetical protein ACTGZS_12705, partial [Streptococcus suis]
MRTGTLLLSLAAFSITGCMNLTPVGPMAELMHKKESAKDSESKSEKPKAKKMEAAAPIIQSAPPPPLP